MQFEFKGKEYAFPAMLSDITLGQRVSFFTEHGEHLLRLQQELENATEDFEKELALTTLNAELAVREFSHYTGIPLETVKAEIDFESLMNIYAVDMALLREQEDAIELQPRYDWLGDVWVIAAPELGPDSKMVLNEFLHAKQAIHAMQQLSKGRWDSLPYLCAVYLRKEGEPFREDMVADGSERLAMMNELPLDIAIAVGFFLTSTMHIYRSTLASSSQEAARESAQQDTLITGDG